LTNFESGVASDSTNDRAPHVATEPDRTRFELESTVPGLVLRTLTAADQAAYAVIADRMVQQEIARGDERAYGEIWAGWGHDFAGSTDAHHRFGIWLDEKIIGRVDLLAVDPPSYGLSYWLDPDFMGRGHAMACVRRVMAFAAELGADALYAGVKPDNVRSIALLKRLEFELIADLGTHQRFRFAFPRHV